MNKKSYRVELSFLLAAAILWGGVYLLFNPIYDKRLYDGYCPELARAMTDDEKIHASLDQINKSAGVFVVDKESGALLKSSEIIGYNNGREILEKFPDCCSVEYLPRRDAKHLTGTYKDEEMSTAGLRKRGDYAGHVHVKYESAYHDKSGELRQAKIADSVLVTNCGKIYSAW